MNSGVNIAHMKLCVRLVLQHKDVMLTTQVQSALHPFSIANTLYSLMYSLQPQRIA